MPHVSHTRNLGRSQSYRKATVRSLTQALLKYERIETTLARAKETQRFAERLITLGKDGSLSARRRAISLLNDAGIVSRLFVEVAPRFSQRPGGYTRILHEGYRPGDGASMAVLELVELKPDLQQKRPKAKEKEAVAPPKSAAPVEVPQPPVERPKPSKVEKKKPEPPKKEEKKPKGFLDGLRGFFKKDRPKQ